MTRLLALIPAMIAAQLALTTLAQAGENNVMVELYTSQGCSSCPPADAYLGELTKRPDVIALSLHVDYWDYLGWQDTLAQQGFTRRQIAYRDARGDRVVYTPQMVIQGSESIVGSDRDAVAAAIDAALATPPEASIRVVGKQGMLEAELLPGTDPMDATLWFAIYSRAETVDIRRGENSGMRITYNNVVTSLGRIGPWDGRQKATMVVPQPDVGEGIALWLQYGQAGQIFAATKFEPPGS